jgi:hypothetical protein
VNAASEVLRYAKSSNMTPLLAGVAAARAAGDLVDPDDPDVVAVGVLVGEATGGDGRADTPGAVPRSGSRADHTWAFGLNVSASAGLITTTTASAHAPAATTT